MFEWNKAFETGIPEIDHQHHELFRIGEDLYQQLIRDEGGNISESLLDCLENLAIYASFHFDTEESLFEEYGYYDCSEHIEEHHAFVDHLDQFDISKIDHDQDAAVRDLLSFISQWIFRHISKTDFKYTAFMKMKMGITA